MFLDTIVNINIVRVLMVDFISCIALLYYRVGDVRMRTLLATYISNVPEFTSNPPTH
jgi:hypothetical protein